MIHIKRCKKCNELFDISTNFDICPSCRMEALPNEKRLVRESFEDILDDFKIKEFDSGQTRIMRFKKQNVVE